MVIEEHDGLPVAVFRSTPDPPKRLIRVRPRKPGFPPKKRAPKMKKLPTGARDLNIRQRRALANYFSGMDKKAAGIKAGYSPTCAKDRTNHALELAAGHELFQKEMEEQGLSTERLVEILAEGLEAKHPIKPENKDFRTIHAFWHDAVKIRDGFPATKINQKTEGRHVHVHITPDDTAAVEKFRRMRGIEVVNQGVEEATGIERPRD